MTAVGDLVHLLSFATKSGTNYKQNQSMYELNGTWEQLKSDIIKATEQTLIYQSR